MESNSDKRSTSVKPTTVKPSGCVHPGTIIATTNGYLSMETIFKIAADYTFVGDEKNLWIKPTIDTFVFDANNTPTKVEKLFMKGFAHVVRVQIGGAPVVCTPDHKFLLTTGAWKRAVDLELGDYIKSY